MLLEPGVGDYQSISSAEVNHHVPSPIPYSQSMRADNLAADARTTSGSPFIDTVLKHSDRTS
jgi:hypothetical protein